MRDLLQGLLTHPDFREEVSWRRQQLPPHQVLFAEGDIGREVYLILTGSVRIAGKVDLDDHRRVQPGVGELGPGQMFGELPLFDGQPRSATVITVTDCELLVMDGDRLLDFLDNHPDLGYPIFKGLIHVLVGRLRQANRRIFSLFAWGLKAHGIDHHL